MLLLPTFPNWNFPLLSGGKVGPALTHPSVLPSTVTLLKLLLFLLPFARFGFLFSLKGLYFSSFPAFHLAQYLQSNPRMLEPHYL